MRCCRSDEESRIHHYVFFKAKIRFFAFASPQNDKMSSVILSEAKDLL